MSLDASIVCTSELDSRGGLAWGGESCSEGGVVVAMRGILGANDRLHDAVDEDIASSETAVFVSFKG